MPVQTMYKMQKMLSILLFYKELLRKLTKFVIGRNLHYVLSYIFVEYMYYKLRKLFKQDLRWIVLPHKVLKHMLHSLEDTPDEYIDYDSCALANTQFLKESPDYWFYISSMVSLRKYKLMIISVPDINENTILISEIMQHNLLNALHCEQLDKSYVILSSEDHVVQFATEAKICLIANPYDCAIELTDALLESYFSFPRYLHVNDVFSIDIEEYTENQFYSSPRPTIPVIYYVVKSLKSICNGHINNVNSAYIVRGESTLIQETQIHSYIPRKHVHSLFDEFLLQQSEETRRLSSDRYSPAMIESFKHLESCIMPFIKKDLQLSIRPIFLVKGPRGCGKHELVKLMSENMGLNLVSVDFAEVQALISAQTEAKLRIVLQKAQRCVPCILYLSNIDIFGKTAEGQKDERIISTFSAEIAALYARHQKFPLIIVATSNETDMPPELQRMFIETIHIKHLNQSKRMGLISWFLTKRNLTCATDLSKTAALCSDFRFIDLLALSLHAVKYQCKLMANHFKRSFALEQEDFDRAYEYMQLVYSDSRGAPRVPEVHWEDIGGLAELKHEISRRIQLPLLDAFGFRQSGLLLYGPPGTGKTLLAKAVATEYQLHFLSVKGPEVLNMYVGQSEKNVRQVFDRARAAAPCIIFFDELDSLAPNRGKSGDSGGVMDRVVSQLLAEMDGLEGSSSIFIIGATNRPDLIDSALLRPGRFDKMLYVGTHSDRASQLSVLKALTRKFEFWENGRELEEIVDRLPSNVTGADLYSISSNAWLNAIRETFTKYNETENANKDFRIEDGMKNSIVIKLQHFLDAIRDLVPSLSNEQMERYNKMRMELLS